MKASGRPRTYPVAGVAISETSFDRALVWLLGAPGRQERLTAHFATAHTITEAARNPALRAALAHADLVAPDGMPLVWLGWLQHRKPARICGPDIMPAIIDRGRALHVRHYFYGGEPGVPERLAAALTGRFPGVQIVGTYSPPFQPLTKDEDALVVQRINSASPDFVWVGLGSPKQDLWVASHRDALSAGVLLAVGAAFNFHAHGLRRAPRFLQRAGLEWAFRLVMEPKRLWRRYTVRNAHFVALVAEQAAHALAKRIKPASTAAVDRGDETRS